MAKRTGEFRDGEMFSVRLDAGTAQELRWAAKESGTGASDLLRRGLGPVLSWIRAEWYEKHGTDEDWEVVPGPAVQGPSRKLHASFGVRLTGEQTMELGEGRRGVRRDHLGLPPRGRACSRRRPEGGRPRAVRAHVDEPGDGG